jgi:uroporphyrin-III C-methyltransferase / precorrin-2 dehydrogenase / sirohydrochlorin ferrochelatase
LDYLPIFLQLQGRACAVIGGGEVAARKTALLIAAGGKVTLTAPALCPALEARRQRGEIVYRADRYTSDAIDGAALVIAATDERSVNAAVSRDAQARGLPINVVDDPELCSFIMPAVVDRSPLVVAVSSGAASPILARQTRARIETLLPATYGDLARFAERFRERVKSALPPAQRRLFWERTLQGVVADLVLAGRPAEAEAALEQALATADRAAQAKGEVYLVGAGPGDPDLLTFAALRLLQQADVVVHDDTIPGAILDLARRDATRLPGVTGSAEPAASPQALLALAAPGKRVLRLRAGDGECGRASLEAAAAAAGVRFSFVPGVAATTDGRDGV